MRFNLEQTAGQRARTAFSLVEVMVSVVAFALVAAGAVYGFAQADRNAEWSAMSLAAQSLASEGLERARSATWETEATSDTTADDLPAPTNILQTAYMKLPASGNNNSNFPVYISVSISNVFANGNPPLRQIIAKCAWQYPLTKGWVTNTVVTQRASN
ncbi:MAG TPA: prepilin-type N-terminal cleavage/methylation domain-containing protein [Verrucomicrobiae bacterium]